MRWLTICALALTSCGQANTAETFRIERTFDSNGFDGRIEPKRITKVTIEFEDGTKMEERK